MEDESVHYERFFKMLPSHLLFICGFHVTEDNSIGIPNICYCPWNRKSEKWRTKCCLNTNDNEECSDKLTSLSPIGLIDHLFSMDDYLHLGCLYYICKLYIQHQFPEGYDEVVKRLHSKCNTFNIKYVPLTKNTKGKMLLVINQIQNNQKGPRDWN